MAMRMYNIARETINRAQMSKFYDDNDDDDDDEDKHIHIEHNSWPNRQQTF